MYVFIAIIFIAELIITFSIINWILKFDKKMLAFGKELNKNLGTTTLLLKQATNLLRTTQNIIERSTGFLSRKKREFIAKIINLVIIYLFLFVFKVKFKKAAAVLQYFLIVKDLWASIPG